MPEPTFYRATLIIQSFDTSADELCDRVRRAVETHPTLSFRLQDVMVERMPPSAHRRGDADVMQMIPLSPGPRESAYLLIMALNLTACPSGRDTKDADETPPAEVPEDPWMPASLLAELDAIEAVIVRGGAS